MCSSKGTDPRRLLTMTQNLFGGLQTDPQVWCVFFAWLDRESPGSFLGHCGESQSPETSLD
jgi:hypothetical protein